METSDLIACGALLVSLITFVWQILSNRKSNKATTKANEIQIETLRLSQKIDNFENRKGEILLLNIIGRYFVIQLNCWELDGRMRTDEISVKKYISELKQLSNDFNELINNPFYIKFIEKHPDINLLIISLRGSIIERESSQQFGINYQTFEFFYNIYADLKKEISGNEILNHKYFKTTDEAAEFLKKELTKLKETSK